MNVLLRESPPSSVWRSSILCSMLVIAFACGGEDGRSRTEAGTATGTRQGDSAAEVPAIADDAILSVVLDANAIDVEMAERARVRAQDTEVRRFAETMIADHNAVNEELRRVAEQTDLTPVAHEISRELRDSVRAAASALDTLSYAPFDRAYMDHEIEHHRMLLELIDRRLAPVAQDTQLKTLLANIRPMIEAHFQRARQIRATLGG